MKQQFLDLTGLTELVAYIKSNVTDKKEILPYASNKLFPSTGDINAIYIDTATNIIYRWDESSKTYKILAQAVKSISISESTENGKITLTVDGVKTTVPIHGLKSAAFTESSAYSPANHTHTKAQIGLGNVDNTADKDKSVKHASTADSATAAGTATTATNVSAEIGQADIARHVWFSDNYTETKRNYNDKFKYNPATNTVTTNISGSAASANSVLWSGVTNKPSTFTPSAHNHDDSTITSLNASKLFGIIDIARLPHGALERLVIVEDDTARFKLTTANVQLGDTVKVIKTEKMYYVVDESKLSSEAGYSVYTAGTATSVPWSGITGKPSSYPPASHNHDERYYTETEMNSKLAEKAAKVHTHVKSEVGLGNVDNTADANKSVKYAASAGTAASCTGNAATATTATKLATARSINGTNFDGSGNITTATWGTARNITIGSTKKSVNGGADVSWSLSEIGAAAASHNHSYLPLSGGTLTGNLNLKPASGEGGEIHLDASTANRTENGIILDQQGGNFRIFGVPSADGKTKTGYGTPLVINPYSKTITGGYTLTGALSGNASTATALTSSAGSATQPVYFSGGKPVACSYTLGKSVPSNAVFTDTNTWRGIQNNLTSDSTSDSLSAAQGKALKALVDSKAASSHTHNYLPLSGGTMTGTAMITWPDSGNWSNSNKNVTFPVIRGGLSWIGQSDGIQLYAVETQNDNLELYLKFTDDNSNGLSIINSTNTHTARISATGEITASKFVGNLAGTASSASAVPWSGITGKPSTFAPAAHSHNKVSGAYTGNGGQQKPNYFGTNQVGFLMMNTAVNNNTHYKDWIIMDCYSGSDVGGAVAFGVNRQSLGAYIMRSESGRASWAESAELLHTSNYTSYTVTKTGSGASGTWGINVSGGAAYPTGFHSRTTSATWGNQTGTFITGWHTNNGGDIQFRDNSGQLNVIIDGIFYQNEGRNVVLDSANYASYAATKNHTHNYAGSSSAGGNANAAVKLATARKIGSASFDGTADITLSQMGLNVPVEITKADYLAKKKAGTLNANTYYNVIDEYDSVNVINDSSVTANSTFSSTKSEKTYAKKSTLVNTTLTASKWTGSSAPYSYVLSVSGVTSSNIVEIDYASNASSAAIEAYQNAMLADGGQTTNQITIKATEKPTVDIPITIVIRNDL